MNAISGFDTKYSNLKLDRIYEKDNLFTLDFSGGLHDSGDWRDYLVSIQEVVDSLYEICNYVEVSDLMTDLDDSFYLTIKVEG